MSLTGEGPLSLCQPYEVTNYICQLTTPRLGEVNLLRVTQPVTTRIKRAKIQSHLSPEQFSLLGAGLRFNSAGPHFMVPQDSCAVSVAHPPSSSSRVTEPGPGCYAPSSGVRASGVTVCDGPILCFESTLSPQVLFYGGEGGEDQKPEHASSHHTQLPPLSSSRADSALSLSATDHLCPPCVP